MKFTKIGVLIEQSHLCHMNIREFIEHCIINNDENTLSIGEGFYINKILNIEKVTVEDLSSITIIADTWGYVEEFNVNDIEDKKEHYDTVVDIDNMTPSDYFVLITLFTQELSEDEFQITVTDKGGQLVCLSPDKCVDNIVDKLVNKFNLYDDIERRLHLLEFCSTTPKPATREEFISFVRELIFNNHWAEKRYSDNSLIVTLMINIELAKYLISLM